MDELRGTTRIWVSHFVYLLHSHAEGVEVGWMRGRWNKRWAAVAANDGPDIPSAWSCPKWSESSHLRPILHNVRDSLLNCIYFPPPSLFLFLPFPPLRSCSVPGRIGYIPTIGFLTLIFWTISPLHLAPAHAMPSSSYHASIASNFLPSSIFHTCFHTHTTRDRDKLSKREQAHSHSRAILTEKNLLFE